MKRSVAALLAGISMTALLVGGCANKEAVKKEESVAPVVSAGKQEQAKLDEQAVSVDRSRDIQPAQYETAQAGSGKSVAAGIKFETAYFDFDKSDLRQDTRGVLSKNAEIILKSLPGAKVQIEGHCDERGSAEYNLALGERRAKSAQQYVTTLGVKAENLSIISYGKEKPAVNGSDEAAWAKNRRAEFVIVK